MGGTKGGGDERWGGGVVGHQSRVVKKFISNFIASFLTVKSLADSYSCYFESLLYFKAFNQNFM